MSSIQNHSGLGNNVGRDLVYVDQSVSVSTVISSQFDARDLTNIVQKLMYDISTGDYCNVRTKIHTYQSVPKLPIDIQNLFSILMEYTKVVDTNDFEDISLLKTELQNSSSLYIELYQSILVKILCKSNIADAKNIYNDFKNEANLYLLAVNDEFFATEDELNKRLTEQLFVLDDYSLFHLARGFWRVNDYQSVVRVLDKISPKGSTENIQFWQIASNFNAISTVNQVPFPYMNRDTEQKMREIIKQFLDLISPKNDLSKLATNILIPMVHLLSGYIPEIMEAGLRFRTNIIDIDAELGETLDQVAQKKPFEVPDWLMPKLEGAQAFNDEELHVLITALVRKSIDMETVEDWLTQSGEISVYDKFYKDFIKILILSFKKYSDRFKENEYRVSISSFIDENDYRLRGVPPTYIMYWCENLYSFHKNFEVVIYNILEIVCKDISVFSDIYRYHLESLLKIDKLKTLQEKLDDIEEEEWNDNLYLIQARYFIKIEDYQQAQKSYQKFIDKNENLYLWWEYIYSCLKDSTDGMLAKQQLVRVPSFLLSSKTIGFEYFVAKVANFIDFDFAERLVVKLFLEHPVDNANFVSKFYLNCIVQRIDTEVDRIKQFEGIYEGVVYKINGKQRQGILVDSKLALHKELIGIETSLGKLLLRLSDGEEEKHDFKTIALVERQAVITTIFQLAIEIVSESQHNFEKPAFHLIDIKEDSAVKDIISSMQQINKDDNTEEATEAFVRESNLSIYLKGKKLEEYLVHKEELEISYTLLLNKYANGCLNKIHGNVIVDKAMVVDIYGVLYLSLTNLYKSIIVSEIIVHISKETAREVESWINNITRDDFLMLNEYEGQLITTDSEVINKYYGNLINALKELLEYASIEPPRLFDLPIIISEMKDLVSDSIFSSIKLALSYDVPWLCLDSIIQPILLKDEQFKLVNFHQLVHQYTEHSCLTFDDRKQAITYWAFSGLYIEYYVADLFKLIENINDIPLLSQFLNETPLNFQNIDTARLFILDMIGQLTIKAYSYRNTASQLRSIEQALYACVEKSLDVLEGDTAEEKIAHIMFTFQTNPYLKYFFVFLTEIIDKFVRGHFMNANAVVNSFREQLLSLDKK